VLLEHSNNPKGFPESTFEARVGWFRDFGHYLFSYERAVELLYEKVASGEQTADSIVAPLVFLMAFLRTRVQIYFGGIALSERSPLRLKEIRTPLTEGSSLSLEGMV